ncbi:MAG: hypothetical protein HN929_04130, partial [Chloroflexi bacterium]|nr:hypothetical protein [Deltaproteobacteria bacterium]MBT7080643.1 hypothetical protein [Chloroflexota bacterium]MBT7710838.1 hypothetical protein [Deltaproteobacteria bacterium]
ANEKIVTGTNNLTLSAAPTFSNGEITSGGGTITLAASTTISGGIFNVGSSTLVLNGDLNLTGTTFTAPDTLQLAANATLTGAGTITVATLTLSDLALTLASTNLTVTNVVTFDNANEQILTGSNNLTLSAAPTFTNGTISSTGGTLTFSVTSTIGGGTFDVTGTTVSQAASFVLSPSTLTTNASTSWSVPAGQSLTWTTGGTFYGSLALAGASAALVVNTTSPVIAATVSSAGGRLDFDVDTTFNTSGSITMSADTEIDIASGKVVSYSGAAINIGANTLTFTGDGTFTNSNDINLSVAGSTLALNSSGTINRVSVVDTAANPNITVAGGNNFSINYLTLYNSATITATGTLTINSSLTTNTNAVELTLSGTVTAHDIILFSDLDIDGTLTLAGDSTLMAKATGDVTFGPGSNLTFPDGLIVDNGTTLKINDSDVAGLTVTIEGGTTITGTGVVSLEGDENLTFQNPTPDSTALAKVTDASSGTLTPVPPITGFAAAGNNTTMQIELSWTNTNSVNVYICRSTLGYLSVPCSSSPVYNAAGAGSPAVTDTVLSDGVTYYYTAFSYSGGIVTPPTTTIASENANAASSNGSVYTDVTSFTAEPRDSKIILSWTNPSTNYSSTIIRRSTSDYPASYNSGDAVYSGTAETNTDTGLKNGTIYFYRAFAVSSTAPIYASGVNAVAAATIIPSGLVSYYPLKGNENDGSGQGNHGTLSNTNASTLSTANVVSESGSAYDFDGSDDYIEIDNPIEDDFSLSVWLKTSQTSGAANTNWYLGKAVLETYTGTLYKHFGMTIGNAGEILYGNTKDDGTGNTLTGSAVNDNEWHNITVTRSKSLGTAKLYIDGTESASSTSAGSLSLNTATLIQIGRQDSAGQYYDGGLDEIRIYNRPINTTEIARLYFSVIGKVEANLSSNLNHSCAIIDGGTAYCWGDDGGASYDRLGDSTSGSGSTPVQVATIDSVLQLSVGKDHSCAVNDNGQVWCWGEGSNGKLGNESTSVQKTPVQVSNISSALQVAAGDEHTCAVIDNSYSSTVQCWGLATNGRLGNNQDSGTYTAPDGTNTQVTSISNAIQVGVGSDFSCALGSDRKVMCWGAGTEGRLGNGDTTEYKTPVYVSTSMISTAIQLSVGNDHACALLADRTIKCWGNGDTGKMGNGTSTTTNSSPVLVSDISTAIQVSVGISHACALLNDGTIKCWGVNSNGQLGNGTTSASEATPVSVSGLGASAVHVSTGDTFTCATLNTGAIQCWGYGANDKLGDAASTASSTTPLTVTTITAAKQ